jgi:hypothetical protein
MKFYGYVEEFKPLDDKERWYWQVAPADDPDNYREGFKSSKKEATEAAYREANVMRIEAQPVTDKWEFEL